MTYRIDEKYFWKNNLGYASTNDAIDKHTYYDIKRDWTEIHKGTIGNCIICSGTARPSVQAKTAPRVAKTGYEAIKELPNVIDHTAEEDEAFAAVNYPPDDGYPTAEQMKAITESIMLRSGKKLSELTEAAQNAVEQDIINTAGAKIDKDGLIKGPMKFDDGKRDWSLLPYDSIEEIAKVLEFGKIKYAAWNWTEGGGFKYTRVFNASMRHLLAFMRGEDKDPDSGLSHIAHLACNVLFLLHFILNKEKYNTCDDRRVP